MSALELSLLLVLYGFLTSLGCGSTFLIRRVSFLALYSPISLDSTSHIAGVEGNAAVGTVRRRGSLQGLTAQQGRLQYE